MIEAGEIETTKRIWTCCQALDVKSMGNMDYVCVSHSPAHKASFFTDVILFFYFFFYVLSLFVCYAGIRSWDTNLVDCNLDQELKLFVSRHSARFSADVRGKLETNVM